MRIAVVCPYDLGLFGGVQQVAIELVERLNRRGHEAWLVGPGHREGARGVGRTVRLRANASVVPLALGPSVGRAVRAAVAGADVIHVHEPLMPQVSTAALASGLPRVLTFHADAPDWVTRIYRRIPGTWVRRIADSTVTAVSPVAAQPLPEAFGPVEIIPNGIDVGAFPTGDKVTGQVAFLGRDDPRKGLDVLLAAWPRIRAAVPGAELVVIGTDRPDAPAGVRYVGRVDTATKRQTLASSVVYVAPNTGGESFGVVIAEGMAAGAAVVASAIPAFEAVLGGVGVTVPVGDPVRLADAVIGLLSNPKEAQRVGEACRTRAAMFDWPSVVDRYLQAYDRARN